MIEVPPKGPKNVFEDILDRTQDALQKWLTAKKRSAISGEQFEEETVCAMKKMAKGTPFEDEIRQTDDRAFPDIVANRCYGVEVKKTSKDHFRAGGNSIFEKTRVGGIDLIYLLMGNRNEVLWSPYSDVLENIVVTHSPRFVINGKADETVFKKMKLSYDEFRGMEMHEKVRHMRNKLYDGKFELWWLATAQFPEYKFYSQLTQCEKKSFVARALVLCPEVFSNKKHKFEKVATLAISTGVIIPNVRDLFSAGGTWHYNEQTFPKIYEVAHTYENRIKEQCLSIAPEALEHFWKGYKGKETTYREWIKRVNAENESYDIRRVLSS